MTEKQLSVILPVYNGERFVGEAIESVLAQDYSPLQLIVVNDGSTDDTERIVKSFPEITYIYQENAGVTAARNTGMQAVTGDLISFIDADDLWPPQKLAVQIDYLTKHPDVEFVVGRTQFVYLPDGRLRTTGDGIPMIEITFILLGSAVFRRSVYDRVGYFDPMIHHGEDVDWFVRAAELNIPMATLPEVGLYRRVHSTNMSHELQSVRAGMFKVIRQSLNRRRAQGKEYEGPILPWAQLHSTQEPGDIP